MPAQTPASDEVVTERDCPLEGVERAARMGGEWDRLARVAAHAARAPLALVSLLEADQMVVRGRSAPELGAGGDGWLTRVQTLCRFVVAAGESLLIGRLDNDPLYRVASTDAADTGAFAGLPLRARGGQVVGCLWVVDPQPRSWADKDVAALRDIAEGAAANLAPPGAARLDETGARIRAVAAAATGVFSAHDEDELQGVLRRACQQVLPFDAFLFATYQPDVDTLHFLGGYDGEVYAPADDVPVPGTPSERVIRERRSLLTLSEDDPASRGARAFGTGRRSQSAIRAPILAGEQVLGILSVQSYERNRYDADDVAVVEVLASVAATTLTNLRLERERRSSQSARREAEQRFTVLMERIEDYALCLLDRSGVVTSWNLGAERITGHSEAEAVGQHASLFYPPELIEEGAHVLDLGTALETGRFETEGWRVRRDGTRFWAHVVVVPIYDETGAHVAFAKISRDLTVLRRAEQEAQLRDAYLERLFDAAPEGIVLLDNEDRVVRVNLEFTRMFGYGVGEVEGRSINDLIVPPEEHLPALELTHRVARGEKLSTEAVRCRKDGTPIPVSILATPIEVEGEQLAVYAIYRDLSDRKQAEAALREAEAELRAVFSAMTDVVLVLDSRGRYLKIPSTRSELPFGPAEAVLGKTVHEVLPPAAAELVQQAIDEVLATGAIVHREYPLEVDGRETWYAATVSPMLGDTVVWAAHDITERKLAERALQASEGRFRSLIENATDLIVVLDADGSVRYASPSVERVLGYPLDRLDAVDPFSLIHPEDRDEVLHGFRYRAERPGVGTTMVFRVRCHDGSWRVLEALATNLLDNPSVHGIVVNAREVTERKQAEEAIRASEERFRSLIENATDLVVVLSAGGNVEYVTPSVERLLGYAPAELEGGSGFALVHPDDAASAVERFTAMLRGGACEEVVEFRVRTRSGAWRALQARARNLLQDPAVAGVVVNCRDITEERAAEKEQHRLSSFLEATPDFVATFDPRGRALSVNAAFRQALGIGDEEMQQLTIADLFPPKVTDQLLHDGIPTAVRRGVWAGESALLTRDGREIPISQLILAHKGASGGVEFLSTLGRDITDRKRAEAALRESEEHFRSLIENAQDIITVLDPQGVILYESAALERVLGYAPEELLGRNVLEMVHPDDQRVVVEALGELVREPGLIRRVELRFRHKDGSWRYLDAVGQRSPEGSTLRGIVVNSRDISERKQAEEALRESEEQLRQAQKMEAVGRLAGGIAHDFNNLLTAIKGFTELLHLDLDERDPRRAYVAEIQSASNRAAALTRQLLAFSRKQVLQPKVLDLNASVLDMEKMLRRLIGEDVELTTLLDPQLGRTQADPGQVEQVILNLVVNARDAMPTGGKLSLATANVAVGERATRRPDDVPPGEYVVLSVRDTGMGMSPEVRERIFEPFFTTKEQGKGTGLGLSTVYGIVKQSDGHVGLETEPGLGTEFRIYLPRVQAEVERREERVQRGPVTGNETVLLVEDELTVRTLVRRVLDRHGYRVLEAGGGAEALERLQLHQGPVHLLLTDVVMPGMSGRELADQVVQRLPHTRVLYMSGYTDEAIVHHGVLDAGVAFLEKPFTPEQLLSKLRSVLDAPAVA